MELLGQFEIETGSVIVSDPCYEKGIWCAGTLENVRKGKWNAYVKIKDEGRPGEIIVAHESVELDKDDAIDLWDEQSFEVGVDSGQAGIFDSAHYQKDEDLKGFERKYEGKSIDTDKWYTMACDRTLSNPGAGTIPFGAVSTSGYGDGGYSCFTTEENGEIVGIGILFIRDNDGEEY